MRSSSRLAERSEPMLKIARDIPAGTLEAGDQALPDGVVIGVSHHDRDRAGRLLGGAGRVHAEGDDAVHLEADQIGGEGGLPGDVSFGKAPLDDKILSFDVAELAQVLLKHLLVAPDPAGIR